jgi:hypothetical protein
LRYQSAYNGNGVINGAFDIWQRGTSFASATLNGYCADRWKYVRASNAAGITISQVTSPQTGFQYGIKQQRTASNTSTDATYLAYGIETKDFLRFAGQTVTLSFYGVKGANFSGVLSLYFAVGTGTDENPLAALTGESILYNSSVSLTTTVARYSVTFAVPSNATDDRFYFSWAPTGTAGADDSFTITGVQLELGSVATTFKRAGGGTIQGELAACQRYYQQVVNGSTQNIGVGWNYSTSYAISMLYLPVVMRTAPTIAVTSGTNYYAFERNGGLDYVNAFFGAANTNPNNAITLRNSTEISGTAGQAGLFFSDNASANISLSAEL